MNNAKMWLVVSPSVGVPLFLGAVAVGSFAVHVAVLSNTSWVSNFLSGADLAEVTTDASTTKLADAKVYFDGTGATADAAEAIVVLSDGRTARAVFDEPIRVSSLGETTQ